MNRELCLASSTATAGMTFEMGTSLADVMAREFPHPSLGESFQELIGQVGETVASWQNRLLKELQNPWPLLIKTLALLNREEGIQISGSTIEASLLVTAFSLLTFGAAGCGPSGIPIEKVGNVALMSDESSQYYFDTAEAYRFLQHHQVALESLKVALKEGEVGSNVHSEIIKLAEGYFSLEQGTAAWGKGSSEIALCDNSVFKELSGVDALNYTAIKELYYIVLNLKQGIDFKAFDRSRSEFNEELYKKACEYADGHWHEWKMVKLDENPPAGTSGKNRQEQPSTVSGNQTYTVQRGDTLFSLAKKFGTTVDALAAANNIADPNKINADQQLVIPGYSSGSSEPSGEPVAPATSTPQPSQPEAIPASPASGEIPPPPQPTATRQPTQEQVSTTPDTVEVELKGGCASPTSIKISGNDAEEIGNGRYNYEVYVFDPANPSELSKKVSVQCGDQNGDGQTDCWVDCP